MVFLQKYGDLVMFSWQHLTAVGVCLLIILLVGIFRKYFIKYKILDAVTRYTIALALILSETILRLDHYFGHSPLVIRNIPIPLCGMLLWICAIALISNSSRIMKAFYPIFLTGATLSMVMCEVPGGAFPSFRAFQYFICHGGFMFGALYFVFTRRINHFTFKDYGWSALILLGMGAVMSFLFVVNKNVFPDDFYVMGEGLPVFRPVYESCGQIGYSLIYIVSIAAFMAIFTLVTWLATRHRKDNDAYVVTYPKLKVLDYLHQHYSYRARKVTIAGLIIGFLYFISWQTVMGKMSIEGHGDPMLATDPLIVGLGWFLGFLWYFIFFAFVVEEVLYNYDMQVKRDENLKIKLDLAGSK